VEWLHYKPVFLFQFLIGRLKTNLAVAFSTSEARFQFLIGRLKTLLISIGIVYPPMFQFLIGRLKTGEGEEERG